MYLGTLIPFLSLFPLIPECPHTHRRVNAKPQAGHFPLLTSPATADDLVNKGVERELAWQLSVKNCYNEQAKLPLPNYYEQLPQGYWEHILHAAKNALMDYLLQPQAELSDTCTPAHAEQIDALITNLAKITLHTPPHAVVYRCTFFSAADETGKSYNTDDRTQAAELELLAEEPYATFLHRDTAADLRKILAAAGLNLAQARPYEDSYGRSLIACRFFC